MGADARDPGGRRSGATVVTASPRRERSVRNPLVICGFVCTGVIGCTGPSADVGVRAWSTPTSTAAAITTASTAAARSVPPEWRIPPTAQPPAGAVDTVSKPENETAGEHPPSAGICTRSHSTTTLNGLEPSDT